MTEEELVKCDLELEFEGFDTIIIIIIIIIIIVIITLLFKSTASVTSCLTVSNSYSFILQGHKRNE